MTRFDTSEERARNKDAADPLRGFRERFAIPKGKDGREVAYLCGNSLGLKPRAADEAVARELERWGTLAVDAHFAGPHPWYSYAERFREPLARLVGAKPHEVVAMNGLTANLHLMLVSFYRPTPERHAILIEDCAFPSDRYAVASQIRFHGFDPGTALWALEARPGETALRTEDVEARLEREGRNIALVLLGGVNYYTGQAYDLKRIAEAAKRHGCAVGFDLAHAAGNVELALHRWGPDFAVWCSYKYLNAGPGAVAGCFVHERHAKRKDLPRFAGWWGNDPKTRFRMHLEPDFVPVEGADGWQLSNPPIFSLAPLAASLELFDEATLPALRAKSLALTDDLLAWLDHASRERIQVLTPRDAAQRGCQISIRVPDGAKSLGGALHEAGIVADAREPDALRLAPVPLYNSFHDVWRAGAAIERWVAAQAGAAHGEAR